MLAGIIIIHPARTASSPYHYHSRRAECLGLRSTKFLGKDMTAEEKELTRSRFIHRGGAVRHAKLIPSRQLMALGKLPRQLFCN
jgi:hypothetical protein